MGVFVVCFCNISDSVNNLVSGTGAFYSRAGSSRDSWQDNCSNIDNHASGPSQPFAVAPPGKSLSRFMAITRIITAWLLRSLWQRKDILRSFEYRRIKINHILKLNQSCLMNLSPRHISVSESTITISLSITSCLKKNAVSSGNVIVIRFASFS